LAFVLSAMLLHPSLIASKKHHEWHHHQYGCAHPAILVLNSI
jgi:hypothetical protein